MNDRSRKILKGVAGGALIVLGVILVPLPGPGIPTIAAGVALLATEFAWAAWLRDRTTALVAKLFGRAPAPV